LRDIPRIAPKHRPVAAGVLSFSFQMPGSGKTFEREGCDQCDARQNGNPAKAACSIHNGFTSIQESLLLIFEPDVR